MQRGYTLIELLVGTGILLFMVGGGIAAYIRFQDKQSVLSGVDAIKMQLRIAQTRARVGDHPEGCTKLQSYAVRTTANSDQVEMVAVCDSGEIERKTTQLPSGITVTTTTDVRFLTLHGGVTGAATIELGSDAGYGYEFEVTQGGEITEGQFIEQEQLVVASPSPSPSPSASAQASPSGFFSPRFSPRASSSSNCQWLGTC